MIIAGLYVVVLAAAAILLALLWLAYRGLVYLWHRLSRAGGGAGRHEVKETFRLVWKGVASLWNTPSGQ